MNYKLILVLIFTIGFYSFSNCQENYSSDPLDAKFVVTLMKQNKYEDWLYGTSGKDERPNDLGYWMGYKITEAYFNKQKDKHQAIYSILHITDPYQFLKESVFLDIYNEKI